MATIDNKDIIDRLIACNGYYHEEDPRAYMIVEYTNAYGNQTYGVTWETEQNHMKNRYLEETEYVHNPKIIWRAEQ